MENRLFLENSFQEKNPFFNRIENGIFDQSGYIFFLCIFLLFSFLYLGQVGIRLYRLLTKREGERERDENTTKREDLFFKNDSPREAAWILARYARSSFLSSTTPSSSPLVCRSCARTLGPRANVRIYDTSYLGVASVRTCIPTHCV